MATRILVTVKGPTGLDGPGRMLAELEGATGLSWQLEEVDQGQVLGGVTEILLTAVLTKGAEMSLEYAVGAVKRLAERWRDERLDPPDTEIRTEPVPDAAAADTDAADTDVPGADGSPADGSDD